MAINTTMSGKELDRVLKQLLDIQNEDNEGKVLCIYQGELAAEDGEAYFDVVPVGGA